MHGPAQIAKSILNGILAIWLLVAVASPSVVRGGLFDCFHHSYQPKNVFTYPERLSLNLRRVAVLPLVPGGRSGADAIGCKQLAPVLRDELTKVKKFEVVAVDPSVLRECTGHAGWSGAETLPADFFSSLRKAYGCDAVMFCDLTVFHPYPPLAIGWRLKLVDACTKQVIWSADEVFDASDPSVALGAKRYESRHEGDSDSWLMRHSPRRFGHYTAATLLNCLPDR